MQCPECESKKIVKNGRRKGKQNYLCRDCNRQFIDAYDQRGYSQKIKDHCLTLYCTILFSPQAIQSNYNAFNIGFLGRLVPEKGIDILFTAVSQLQSQGLNCRITICGSGSSEADLRQEAKNQKLEDIVTWKDAVRHEETPQVISKLATNLRRDSRQGKSLKLG